MKTVKIDARFEWEWEDGDGTKCQICADAAWLKQLRAVVVIGTTSAATDTIELTGGTPEELNRAREVLTGKMKLDIVLCSSCGDVLKSA